MPLEPAVADRTRYRWYHKLAAVVFIVFCVEIGAFLLLFPWSDAWERNFLSELIPQMQSWWDSRYVKGAVSGLGALNLYISLVEIYRLRRFAKR